MQPIYKPTGKAGEYGELAINLYDGCVFNCTYCWARQMALRTGKIKTAAEWKIAKPRTGMIQALKKDIKKYTDKEIFLCFTCDPYQPIELEHQLTRQAIEIIKSNNNRVRILTKSVIVCKDFSLLDSNDWIGTTFTLLFNWYQFEPLANVPEHRMTALKLAKERGINTWASLEPVIEPIQTLEIIRRTHDFVDEYKIGKWNYDERANKIGWHNFVNEAIELLEKYNKKYYIKESLRKYIGGNECE